MFRPIRVDHTNCLQVAIKTHHQSSVKKRSLDNICVLSLTVELSRPVESEDDEHKPPSSRQLDLHRSSSTQ